MINTSNRLIEVLNISRLIWDTTQFPIKADALLFASQLEDRETEISCHGHGSTKERNAALRVVMLTFMIKRSQNMKGIMQLFLTKIPFLYAKKTDLLKILNKLAFFKTYISSWGISKTTFILIFFSFLHLQSKFRF